MPITKRCSCRRCFCSICFSSSARNDCTAIQVMPSTETTGISSPPATDLFCASFPLLIVVVVQLCPNSKSALLVVATLPASNAHPEGGPQNTIRHVQPYYYFVSCTKWPVVIPEGHKLQKLERFILELELRVFELYWSLQFKKIRKN